MGRVPLHFGTNPKSGPAQTPADHRRLEGTAGFVIAPLAIDEAAGEWVLNGTKTWATNGGIANVHIVVASVYPELGTRGQVSFVIPPETKGLAQGQKFKKHGIRASHTAEVVLDNVRLPEDCVLGGREKFEARIARVKSGSSAGGLTEAGGGAPGRTRTGTPFGQQILSLPRLPVSPQGQDHRGPRIWAGGCAVNRPHRFDTLQRRL